MKPDQAVAFVDTGNFPRIDEYFQCVPFVFLAPSRPQLRISKVVPINGMSLANLADAMSMELSSGQSAVIYSHGSATQLRIGRTYSGDASSLYPTASDFNYLANHCDGIRKKSISNLNPAHALFRIDSNVGAKLIDDLKAIQKLRINHLCVLACNTGNGPELLHGMKRAFGAQSISGPRFQCAFGRISFGIFDNQEEFSKILAKVQHGVNGWHVYGTTPGRRLAFHRVVNPNSSFTFTRNDLWAESSFAIADFQRDIVGYPLPGSGYVQKQPTFLMHALETRTKLVFPQEYAYDQNFTYL